MLPWADGSVLHFVGEPPLDSSATQIFKFRILVQSRAGGFTYTGKLKAATLRCFNLPSPIPAVHFEIVSQKRAWG
jgi:hypothetical protein